MLFTRTPLVPVFGIFRPHSQFPFPRCFITRLQNCEKRLLASSVRSHGTARLPMDRISWNFTFEYFSKIQVSLKCDKERRLCMKIMCICTHFTLITVLCLVLQCDSIWLVSVSNTVGCVLSATYVSHPFMCNWMVFRHIRKTAKSDY